MLNRPKWSLRRAIHPLASKGVRTRWPRTRSSRSSKQSTRYILVFLEFSRLRTRFRIPLILSMSNTKWFKNIVKVILTNLQIFGPRSTALRARRRPPRRPRRGARPSATATASSSSRSCATRTSSWRRPPQPYSRLLSVRVHQHL